MSKEEILEILKEFNKIKINSYAMQFVNIPYPKLQMAIQGLLDLYEKEKEKNKSIVYNYEMVVDKLENSISKDKIKQKIEYLLKRYDSEEDFCSYDVVISILQELLGE